LHRKIELAEKFFVLLVVKIGSADFSLAICIGNTGLRKNKLDLRAAKPLRFPAKAFLDAQSGPEKFQARFAAGKPASPFVPSARPLVKAGCRQDHPLGPLSSSSALLPLPPGAELELSGPGGCLSRPAIPGALPRPVGHHLVS
jgi:hypothetical protein